MSIDEDDEDKSCNTYPFLYVHFSHVSLDNTLSQVTVGDHGQGLGSSEFTTAIRV